MNTVRVIATALVMLFLLPTSSQANAREIHVEYYSDSMLNNLVGETTDWCDDSFSSWGNIAAAYLAHYDVSCYNGEVTNVACYYWNGSSYAPMDCYWDGALARIRIPIGQ